MTDTITTCTGRILTVRCRSGACRDHLALSPRAVLCGAPAVELACDPGVPGRHEESRCYCLAHGGEAQALAELAADWMLQAPPAVGGAEAVLEAGTAALGSEHAYVVVREHCGRWLALLGIGGHTTPVRRADPNPEAARKHEVARKAGRRRPGGGSSWATADEAEAAGVDAWRTGVEARVAEITRLRGGTLAWGVPVTPRPEPIVLRPAPGQSAYACDRVRRIVELLPGAVVDRVPCATRIAVGRHEVLVEDSDVVTVGGKNWSGCRADEIAARVTAR